MKIKKLDGKDFVVYKELFIIVQNALFCYFMLKKLCFQGANKNEHGILNI